MFSNIHHKPIKKFGMDGIIVDDASIGRLRIECSKLVTEEMKVMGYVPRLDIDPDFTIRYNHIKEYFEFTLSVYGSYIGRKRAQWTIGIDGTEVIAIQPSKSKESSQGQESQLNQK
jgi:hypothetical protein